MKDALCADFDAAHQKLQEQGAGVNRDELYADMFYSADFGVNRRNDKVQHLAKKICGLCIVKDECLDYALNGGSGTRYGIWGGKTVAERRLTRR